MMGPSSPAPGASCDGQPAPQGPYLQSAGRHGTALAMTRLAHREPGGDMVGIIGIFVSLALLIYLAQRGWNVIFIAPICATVAILLNWGDLPVLASYTQIYMPALGSYFAT